MTDPAGATPEQDAVRRLLAQARHDGPTPPEVVARLDERLASLVSERESLPAPAVVVDLGARRRRTAGIGLLAAAAVVVAGVALGQALPRTSGGDDAGASSAGSDMVTSQEPGPSDGSADTGGGDAGSGAAEQSPESLKSAASAPEAAYPTLSSADTGLDADLLDLRTSRTPGLAGLDAARTLTGCDLQGVAPGRRVGAQVDGLSGVVVFRRPDGATQQVELYVCGTSRPVRTITLPAP